MPITDQKTLLQTAAALPTTPADTEMASAQGSEVAPATATKNVTRVLAHYLVTATYDGEKQFSDRAVNDPAVISLRGKVIPEISHGIDPAQVDMTIVLKGGRRLHRYIEHAVGSAEIPMTDRQLESKFADLADGIIPAPMIGRGV